MDRNGTIFLTVFVIVSLLAGALLYGLLAGQWGTDRWLTQLYFAAGTLGGLAYILILCIAAYLWGPSRNETEPEPRGKVVFDTMSKIIPPILTLILGYYFGLAGQPKEATEPKPNPPVHQAGGTESH